MSFPTPTQIARHQRAINKLRQRIFRRYSMADYGIVEGSESIDGPTKDQPWLLGGLRYRLNITDRETMWWISAEHSEDTRFWVRVSYNEKRGSTPKHIRLQFIADFEDLDSQILGDVTFDVPRYKRRSNGRIDLLGFRGCLSRFGGLGINPAE